MDEGPQQSYKDQGRNHWVVGGGGGSRTPFPPKKKLDGPTELF